MLVASWAQTGLAQGVPREDFEVGIPSWAILTGQRPASEGTP